MILLINLCKEKLHYYEFVKPIEDILKKNKLKYFKKHYRRLSDGDLKNAKKIIICGTSLKDNDFVKDVDYFLWIKGFKKPILGICGGMQIIGLIFDLDRQVKNLDIRKDFSHALKKKTEIGFYHESFKKDFLGLLGEQEVYHLHNNYIDFDKLEEFEIFAKNSEIIQALKHKEKEIYGVLFHPEVRQKDLIINFCKAA
jgi:anthranilate/para-aminobenzoate synthase component II